MVRPAPAAATTSSSSSSLLFTAAPPPLPLRVRRRSKSVPNPAAVRALHSLPFRESRRPPSSGSAVPFVSVSLYRVSLSPARPRRARARARCGLRALPRPIDVSLVLAPSLFFFFSLSLSFSLGYSDGRRSRLCQRKLLSLYFSPPSLAFLPFDPLSRLLCDGGNDDDDNGSGGCGCGCGGSGGGGGGSDSGSGSDGDNDDEDNRFMLRSSVSRVYVRRITHACNSRRGTHEYTSRLHLSLAVSTTRGTITTTHHKLSTFLAPLTGRLREPCVALTLSPSLSRCCAPTTSLSLAHVEARERERAGRRGRERLGRRGVDDCGDDRRCRRR